MRLDGGEHGTKVRLGPFAPTRPPGIHPLAVQLEVPACPSLDSAAEQPNEVGAGTALRLDISKSDFQNSPSGASTDEGGKRGYRTGSTANSVSSSTSASITTLVPSTFTALTRSPCATFGETKTPTSEQGSPPPGSTRGLRISSRPRSSPSHCRARSLIELRKPCPNKLRNAPTGQAGLGRAKARSISPARPVRFQPSCLRRCSCGRPDHHRSVGEQG